MQSACHQTQGYYSPRRRGLHPRQGIILMTKQTIEAACRNACESIGVDYKPVPTDGLFHTADLTGDHKGKNDGRIKIFQDRQGGIAWNHKSGVKQTFFINRLAGEPTPQVDHEHIQREQQRRQLGQQAVNGSVAVAPIHGDFNDYAINLKAASLTVKEFEVLIDSTEDFEVLTEKLPQRLAMAGFKRPAVEMLISKIAKKACVPKASLRDVMRGCHD